MEEQNKEYFDVESISETFAKVGEILASTLNSIIKAFKNIIPEVLNTFTNTSSELIKKRISKKRFIKLLMSRGIQRNNAQEIAESYHKNQGYYCLFDVVIEWRKNNE